MVERQAIARLNREFSLFRKTENSQFTACPSDADTLTWHYVLYNLPAESPYHGGQYHGKLVFPREYPLKPPSIFMTTPSGRFEVGKRLCLSMSDYHPETWNPSWRVETILLGLISFMLDESDPTTAGGINESRYQRQIDAKLSFFRNRRNREFRSLFPDLVKSDKYFIEVGFIPMSTQNLKEPGVLISLVQCGLSDSDIDSVHSIDDLDRALSSRGFMLSSTRKRGVNITNMLLPWLTVAIVGSVWVYSQLNPT